MVIYLIELQSLGATDILQGVLVIGGAVLFILPFFRFRNIVLTEGQDVEELMKALKGVAMAFVVVAVLTLINLVVMIFSL